MGAASSAKPIEGPKTPMELVASLKKFVEATEVNFDDALLQPGGHRCLHRRVERDRAAREGGARADAGMAEEEAVVADPKVMVEAAEKGDMAVVRKQLKAGVAVDTPKRRADRMDRADQGGSRQPDQDVQVPGDEGCGHKREEQVRSHRDDVGGQNGNTELVGYLHENGAEVNAQNGKVHCPDVGGTGAARPPRPNS